MTHAGQQNAEVIQRDPSYNLLKATVKGDIHQVICSIQDGAKIAVNQNGHTPLHIAAYKGFLDIVRVLLNSGCDLDTPDDHGDTALHRACVAGHDRIVKRLIEEGACINRQNEFGYTGLHEAAYRGFSRIVNYLINSRANIKCKNKHGDTAIHLASANGHSGSLRLLLNGYPHASPSNNRKETPLHLAVRFNHVTCARVLISARCNVNLVDEKGNTPLHIACITRNKKLSRILLDAGASNSSQNLANKTPLDIARDIDDGELIYIIVSGARPNPHSTKRRCRSLSRDRSRHRDRRAKSEARNQPDGKLEAVPTKSSPKPRHKIKAKELQQRPKSSTLPRKVLNHRRRQRDAAFTASNEDILTEFQKKTSVNKYIVPQLYSLYRDSNGEIKQHPVLSELPNPTPEIVSTLANEVENTKGELLNEINKKTSDLSHKLDYLTEKTEHRFHKLDKLTYQRISAERSQCLHRIDRRATLERTISKKLVSESLNNWLSLKKNSIQGTKEPLKNDATIIEQKRRASEPNNNFLSHERNDSANSDLDSKSIEAITSEQLSPSKTLEGNALMAQTDSAYDSLSPYVTCYQQKSPYKHGNSYPRRKTSECALPSVNNQNHAGSKFHSLLQNEQNISPLSYDETADLTAHVTQHLFENVSSAMEQWYEKRLKDVTEQRNLELSRRVAALEEQLRKSNVSAVENPAEHLV